MSNKEDFLKVKTYEEYDRRRDEFRNLDIRDPEILNHLDELYPKLEKSGWEDGIIEEVYSYLPDGQRVLGGNQQNYGAVRVFPERDRGKQPGI